MCDCIEKVEKTLTEEFITEVNPSSFESIQLKNKTIMISDGSVRLNGEMRIMYKKAPAGKNSESGGRWKKYFIYTYCPFCGEKYDKP